MTAPISSIPVAVPVQVPAIPAADSTTPGFQSVLQSAIQQVEGSRTTADQAVRSFVSGEDQELHSTILATQKAELQFEMFMQVRNKVISAYEEVMRMQL